MSAETRRAASVLSAGELEAFRRDGFVRLKAAFPRELALEMRDAIWDELREDHGIDRADRGTWRTPPRSPQRAKHLPLNARLASDRFQGAISDLLGRDDWERPASWGGFPVFFPKPPGTAWDVPDDTWHWDGAPDAAGLLVFTFYSQVRPGGGGTLLLSGSHRLIAEFYASLSPEELARAHKVHRKLFSTWDPWLAALTGRSKEPVPNRIEAFMERTTEVRGVPCRVVELTGEPGDAVFCNLGMLHAVAPNCSDEPRFLRSKFLFLEPEKTR